MPTPYDLRIERDCRLCSVRPERPFCNMTDEAVAVLDSITFTAAYPKGSILFAEGELPRGVFIICNGRVKLTTTSSDGRTLILRVAEAGEVLGVSSTVANRRYEVSAETLTACQINSIRQDDFLKFMESHVEVSLHSARSLADAYQATQRDVRTLGLSTTVAERLAHLLIHWANDAETDGDDIRIEVPLTHEEIAELIGTTRETVTRTLTEMKKRNLLIVDGPVFVVRDMPALERIVVHGKIEDA